MQRTHSCFYSRRDVHDREAERVVAVVPGWRCVWLPRHGRYLAFQEAEMVDSSIAPPAVAEPDVDGVIAAIEALGELRDLVREWLRTQKQCEGSGIHD